MSSSNDKNILSDISNGVKSNKNEKSKANYNEANDEAWLIYYMLAKIKEKMNVDILDCVQDYKNAYEYLDQSITCYLNKITYKSKSCLNLEANEVYKNQFFFVIFIRYLINIR